MNNVTIQGAVTYCNLKYRLLPLLPRQFEKPLKNEAIMIVSLLTTGLIVTMAIMGAAILWDSGLRWMSALGQLQRQLKEIDEPVMGQTMGLRPQASARFVSAAATYSVTKRSTPRAAA